MKEKDFLGKLRENWPKDIAHAHKHVPLMLAGRFKEEVGEKSFCQSLAWQSNSGIMIGQWFHRSLFYAEKFGITTGPMFRVTTKNNRFKRAQWVI